MTMRHRLIASVLLLGFCAPVRAEEPLTLNDLPRIIYTLEDCGVLTCGNVKVTAFVRDSAVDFMYEDGSQISIFGHGHDVQSALQDLVSKINQATDNGRQAVKNVAPLLPSQ